MSLELQEARQKAEEWRTIARRLASVILTPGCEAALKELERIDGVPDAVDLEAQG